MIDIQKDIYQHIYKERDTGRGIEGDVNDRYTERHIPTYI